MIPSPAPRLAPGKLALKYLFCAQLADGAVVEQTPEDVSATMPGRNAFYDLLDPESRIEKSTGMLATRSDVVLFQLEDEAHRYLLDLRDGHFEVQYRSGGVIVGAPFFVEIPKSDQAVKLVYFRRRRHHANCTMGTGEDGRTEIKEIAETGQECEYHLGWTQDGRERPCTLVLV